ncbi:serine/threonine-protein kinase [Actinocrispum wychmicini]|uniref:non-specific serine/threonine protein kinase n=1 Tax=Actinocrispum wychmicini TaxID=1213861 RepID=A0A4R2JHJ4_9PSEU|nr:serine/threonine-protein kinase [Actinocrispum wychmicini]TCO53595.1 serine/threonine protein kinase [Actinocrispum wychmicini]
MRLLREGRYTFVSELGRGGMGVVWLAKDTVLGRDVAIKELMVPGGIPVDQRAEYQERVLREARIASRLANPGIVTIHDLITEHGQMYIVMELVKAPSLTEWVERHGPMPVPRAAKLAEQVLGALEAAHEAGVVHRDVKPSNVMVPDKGTAKLADFGIAQSYDDTRITSTGMIIGSPAYMSPERLSSGDASPAWDLWALGATLYYAVEGRGAYERQTTTETILAVMTDRPQLRLAQGPMAELITGLLDHDPSRRISPARAHKLIEQALQSDNETTTRFAPVQDVPPPMPAPVPVPVPVPPVQYTYRPPGAVDYGRRRPVLQGVIWLAILGLLAAGVIFVPRLIAKIAEASATDSATGDTGGATKAPKTSKATQPVLTFGPGGDITSEYLTVGAEDCYKWLPTKGKPGPKTDNEVGCYAPYDTQSLWGGVLTSDQGDIPYPSAEQLTAVGAGGCTERFLDKVTYPDKENALKVWTLVPTAEAWKVKVKNGYRQSTRTYSCFVSKADGSKLTAPVWEL